MSRIAPSLVPTPGSNRGIDAEIQHNVNAFSRTAALSGRIDAARNHHQTAFAQTAALDSQLTSQMHHPLAEFSMQKKPLADASTAMAPRIPLPPRMPPEGFNHPRPAQLHAPSSNPKLHPVANSGPMAQDPRAAHLGQLDPQSGVFVGTGKWNGSDQPASTLPSRSEPLKPHEYQQTGYQLGVRLASTAPHREGELPFEPIEHPSDLAHLRNATEVMHQTRTSLMFGRGNVTTDVRATNGESSARAQVSYDFGVLNGSSVLGGVALAMGAGNCDQNGRINARRYAPMLGEGETVDTIMNKAYSHCWTQINQPPQTTTNGRTEARPTIVMDSWADGPAVRLGDSAWSPQAASSTVVEQLDKSNGTKELNKMNQAWVDAATPDGPLHPHAMSLLSQNMQKPPKYSAFAPNSVVSAPLAKKAQEQMMEQSAFTREVMAVAAARQGYNLNVAEATKSTTSAATLDATMNLDRPDRPPILVRVNPAQ